MLDGVKVNEDGCPVCVACGGYLDDEFQVLVRVELWVPATVDSSGDLDFQDPRTAFDFDWELAETECPHCGADLRTGEKS